ncbi:MAG: hypothetical protein AB1589_19620 [Cyanobacteriota bacterium]
MWYFYQKLGVLSVTGAAMIVAMSLAGKVPANAALFKDEQVVDIKAKQRILPISWKRSLKSVEPQRSRSAATEHNRLFRSLLVQNSKTDVPLSPIDLPPANVPIPQQNRVVSVPPLTRPEALIPSPPAAATSPTLPPSVFPSTQTPAVSVPPLQPISAQTPTSATTSQFVEPLPESLSSPVSSSPVIEFGQALPLLTPAASEFQIQ